ncbi:HNH endonuclease [Pseudaminobacter arsenicus]|uniref:HNH endonuclease n=1 Tax=Borborobacter arsenicus TaxID=1851146 RepID=A0A432VA12_9HYPH|nr:HNH endonuclease signature motif containing protein [Pseudaminobacter arsenicus]RUM99021.1 HNH endonuclease [Pseudaminobacter arsenicus]
MGKPDYRSAEATAYRRLYKTARWQRVREAVLTEHPLCAMCLAMEIVEPATVVHHKDGGHKGDEDKFWSGPFEALCKACHDLFGDAEDRGKTVVAFGDDGWPL